MKSPYGFTWGGLGKSGVRMYISARMDKGIIKELKYVDSFDNLINLNNSSSEQPTGISETGIGSFSAGLTFKLAYPVWLYVGGGITHNTQYHEVDSYDRSGDFEETVWLKNMEQTNNQYFPEGGLLIRISKAVVLKYGVAYNNEITHQFGLGLPF